MEIGEKIILLDLLNNEENEEIEIIEDGKVKSLSAEEIKVLKEVNNEQE